MKAICHDCKYLGEADGSPEVKEYYLQCNFPMPMVIVPYCTSVCRFITQKMVNEADQWPRLQHCELYEKK